MGLAREARELIDYAGAIELYAHKSRIVVRLEMGDYEAALSLCRRAVAQSSELAEEQPIGQRRDFHVQNGRKIRLLEAMIAEAHLRHERETQVTMF